jgi:hypothetical protein
MWDDQVCAPMANLIDPQIGRFAPIRADALKVLMKCGITRTIVLTLDFT